MKIEDILVYCISKENMKQHSVQNCIHILRNWLNCLKLNLKNRDNHIQMSMYFK